MNLPLWCKFYGISSCILLNLDSARPQSRLHTIAVFIPHGNRDYFNLLIERQGLLFPSFTLRTCLLPGGALKISLLAVFEIFFETYDVMCCRVDSTSADHCELIWSTSRWDCFSVNVHHIEQSSSYIALLVRHLERQCVIASGPWYFCHSLNATLSDLMREKCRMENLYANSGALSGVKQRIIKSRACFR